MSKTTDELSKLNHKLNKYVINPISETVSREAEMMIDQAKKLTEPRSTTIRYPKNGLYGLL